MTIPSDDANDGVDPTPTVDTPSTPTVQPPSPKGQGLRIGPILRDVALVFVLTALGGFVVGMVTGGPERNPQGFMIGLAVTNIVLGTIGFTIVGCLAAPNRWPHLALVAAGAWLTGLAGVATGGVTIPAWIGGAIFVAMTAVLGGGLSYLFRRSA